MAALRAPPAPKAQETQAAGLHRPMAALCSWLAEGDHIAAIFVNHRF